MPSGPEHGPATEERLLEMLDNFASGKYQAIAQDTVRLAAQRIRDYRKSAEALRLKYPYVPHDELANPAQGYGKSLTSACHPTPVHAAIAYLGSKGILATVDITIDQIHAALVGPPVIGVARHIFRLDQVLEVGNWLIDTARQLYPDRGWDDEEPSPPLRESAIEDAMITVARAEGRLHERRDHELELAYARADAYRSALWVQVVALLEALENMHPGAPLADFNAMRYNVSENMARDIQQQIRNVLKHEKWYKP